MKKVQQGFTLIELMIVVAIIGILAAVAIPQYQDYVARSKLGAMVTAVDSLKTAMAEGFQADGAFPSGAQLTAAGITVVPPKDATLTITGGTSGVIVITTTAALGNGAPVGSTVTFTATPSTGDTTIQWIATTNISNNALKEYVLKKLSGT